MDDRDILEKVLKLSQENNAMLRKMHSIMRWARVVRIIYWVVLIGGAIGVFYYIEPFFSQILDVYSGVGDFFGR